MVRRFFVGALVYAVVSGAVKAAEPGEGRNAELALKSLDDFYNAICEENTTCTVFPQADRFERFFNETSWKFVLDPPSVVDGKVRVAFSPDDRVEFLGLRYFENIVQVAPPVIEGANDNDDESFVVIQFKNLAPFEGPVDIAEVIFGDRRPAESPTEVVFNSQASGDDFLTIVDDRQLITLGPAEIIPDVVQIEESDVRTGLLRNGELGDDRLSIVYDTNSGELGLDVPEDISLTAISIRSNAAIFTEASARNLGGANNPFDVDEDADLFKIVFGSSFGSLSFGDVAQSGLTENFVLSDLNVVAALGGAGVSAGRAGRFDLVFQNPEPSSLILALIGFMSFALLRRP